MAYDLTAGEAAEQLGVSRARLYQLINNNSVSAEKIGGIWLVDSATIENRKANAPSSGRPAKTKSKAISTYTLMSQNFPVLGLEFDSDANTFLDSREILDAQRAPLGVVSPQGKAASGKALTYWWQHRCIPKTRDGMHAKLQQLGVSDPDLIPFRSLGLSLSDTYWIKPTNSSLKWEDINFFENNFYDMAASRDWLDAVGLDSPDNTSEGELPKKWTCVRGDRVLVKGGGPLGQEPYNEAVATALYRRVLNPEEFVVYKVEESRLGPVSECAAFTDSNLEYIPAFYVRQIMRKANHHSDFQHYIECCAKLGVLDAELALSKMIVCDDLLANFDRHWRNFGLVRNVETLECGTAPLFDSGSSLWCNVSTRVLAAGDFSFETKPFYEDANRQLRLVNNYSWLDVHALDGFAEEVAEILSQCETVKDRVSYIKEGIQRRIDRLKLLI